MQIRYVEKNNGVYEEIVSSTHSTREEAHTAAIALADSLVDNENAIEVLRGYMIDETTFIARVSYDIPPTDAQRNPSEHIGE